MCVCVCVYVCVCADNTTVHPKRNWASDCGNS